MKLSRQLRNSVAVAARLFASKKLTEELKTDKAYFQSEVKKGPEYLAFKAYLSERYKGQIPDRLEYHEREILNAILGTFEKENLILPNLAEIEALADLHAPEFETKKDLAEFISRLILNS